MTARVKQLMDQAMALTDAERVTLLLELISRTTPQKLDHEILTPEFKAELERRLAHMDAHPEDSKPMEEVFRRLRNKQSAKTT
jgi:putative addiction module component (TIGR02574 family)